jgi:hypothetical protein
VLAKFRESACGCFLPLSKCRDVFALAPSFEAYFGFPHNSKYDATFSTNQARRGGDHNFTANGTKANPPAPSLLRRKKKAWIF